MMLRIIHFFLFFLLSSLSCLNQREIMLVLFSFPIHSFLVSLTQTKSKGKEHKDDVVNKIREAIDTFKFIYVLQFDNLRTNAFKDLRSQLSDSRYVSILYGIVK